MLINFDDQINKLQDIRTGKVKEGLKLGFPSLDEHMRFKFGNFNIVLGHANSGKTTLTLFFMLLYSLKHKIKWLVFSSENEPYSIIKKLIEFIAVKPINKISDEEFNKHKDFLYLIILSLLIVTSYILISRLLTLLLLSKMLGIMMAF